MKLKPNQMLVTFATEEDAIWSAKMIFRARANAQKSGGTPLAGGAASILLCALGRSTETEAGFTSSEVASVVLNAGKAWNK